ncbi:hypothetical protein [Gimesia sp.]|uniref:hypothetical protein n=1 Tax=Gimesia sp. TaxID=2024833 RepID=UPI003A934028
MNEPLNLSVRKFYFLEYFYILLKSVERYEDRDQVFNLFKLLKQEHRLGESKFKKLTIETEDLTPVQESRYRYTLNQVIEDSKDYGLVSEGSNKLLNLTSDGKSLLKTYGTEEFNLTLFRLMETKSSAFRYLIERMYEANTKQPGLLIFPIYSPYQLNIERSTIQTTADIRRYADTLVRKLKIDIESYLGGIKNLCLDSANERLIQQLFSNKVIPVENAEKFQPHKYNAIVSRFRKFWLNYFLKEVYGYRLSLSAFDIWIYRAKQIGLIQVTESYPNFQGRIMYPTSVIVSDTKNIDFKQLFEYSDGMRLFAHRPDLKYSSSDDLKEVEELSSFVDCLVQMYLALRRTTRNYFINLSSLRELVCYNMQISEMVFARLLNRAYQLNMTGDLKVRISLEVDKLPEETKAMYQKYDPVMIDGKYRNIIAIDVTQGEK